MRKQFIAKLLVLAMVLGMVPVTILAASAAGGTTNNGNYNYGYYSVGMDTNVNTAITDTTITLTVVGGTAVKNFGDTATASLSKQVGDDDVITLTLKADGADRINITFGGNALTRLALKTGADLVIKSDIATVTIPNAALSTAFKDAKSVRIALQSMNGEKTATIRLDGTVVDIEGVVVTVD